MVFCFQNWSDIRWGKIVLEKNKTKTDQEKLLKFKTLKNNLRSLEKSIGTVKGFNIVGADC